ncbi:MAG: pyridoxine 5'-phosphate synthase [Pseudomonadales bacterium]
MSTIALSVNLNKIALIRNSRVGDSPNVVDFAQRSIKAGVHGITVHPRPDQRHIRASDVAPLSTLCADHANVEFNIEGNPAAGAQHSGRNDVTHYPGFLELVESVQPEQCTLVPDNQHQLTSDHGFDLTGDNRLLAQHIERCKHAGSRVSLFMDPEPEQIKRAAELNADRIELYTGPYAASFAHHGTGNGEFDRYCIAAECATKCGLGVNAGHDLNLENLTEFRQLPGLLEVSIGHAFTIDALLNGWGACTDAYLDVLSHK